ncbi:hypothetical protein GGX14DRAFT_396741 [Mycena pura]|uniref:Uncharacterized protein n=1 Tax=Mycena pura TaxID=153505 RepID=A0AAD6VA71_9AGAR|nr:hypothetical protein GGX14DRAFT_396741 [Mycena pura]
MSQVTVIQCNLSDMDRLNLAIEDFTRNLGPATLSFCSSVNHEPQPGSTALYDSRRWKYGRRDGEECVFLAYELAVAMDRAFVAVAVAEFNYEVAKAQGEPRSLRVQLLLARCTAVQEATKAVRAFSTALELFEEASVW